MKVIILDGARFENIESAHEYIKGKMGFPEHYGANLDALDDCLSELPRSTSVVIINRDAAIMNLGKKAAEIFAVFSEILGVKCRFVII